MTSSEILLLVAVTGLASYALYSGGWPRLREAGQETINLFGSIWLPMILGFTTAGLIAVLLPTDLIGRYLGADSGFGGLLLATLAGLVTPGGAFMQFPIVAALLRSGAGPGPLAAYLTAWSLFPVHRTLIWEVPFLGAQFAIARIMVSAALPLLIGLAVPRLLRLLDQWWATHP